jgi:hypothetical protein
MALRRVELEPRLRYTAGCHERFAVRRSYLAALSGCDPGTPGVCRVHEYSGRDVYPYRCDDWHYNLRPNGSSRMM